VPRLKPAPSIPQCSGLTTCFETESEMRSLPSVIWMLDTPKTVPSGYTIPIVALWLK